MSFSCPHYDCADDGTCMRLTQRCVPGRPGCVLRRNSRFLVPVEERLEDEAPKPAAPAPPSPGGAKRRRSGPI